MLFRSSLIEILQLQSENAEQKNSPLVYPRLVVVEKEGNRWVFPVDEVSGIQHFESSDLMNLPVTAMKATPMHMTGIFHRDNKSIGYLDHETFFHALKRSVL